MNTQIHYIDSPSDPIGTPFQIEGAEQLPLSAIKNWGINRYLGPARLQQFLLDKMFPLGSASMISAMGDTGKGMLILNIALCVTSKIFQQKTALGPPVTENGSVVIFSAEDDIDEIHRRLERLDPEMLRNQNNNQLYIIPLPNAGGVFPIIQSGTYGKKLEISAAFELIRQQLLEIKNLKMIVFDPLSSFVHGDLNDAAVSAFTTGTFSKLAADTGAAVIIVSHMRKFGKQPILTPGDAREAVRGSSALMDGVRFAYALWPAPDNVYKIVSKVINGKIENNSVYQGAVIKSNGKADRKTRTYLRSDTGLLQDITDKIQLIKGKYDKSLNDTFKQEMIETIANSAKSGHPFTKTGEAGVFKQRERLPAIFHDISKHSLESMVQELLQDKQILTCRADGSKITKWLDIPGGPFANGNGEFIHGAEIINNHQEKESNHE
jgi:AAA domain